MHYRICERALGSSARLLARLSHRGYSTERAQIGSLSSQWTASKGLPGSSTLSDVSSSQVVKVAGWISRPRRAGASLAFATLRDSSGVVQIVSDTSSNSTENLDTFLGLSPESVVEIEGTLAERVKPANAMNATAADTNDDIEVRMHSMKLINRADPLPFETNLKALHPDNPSRPNDETMLKYRYIEMRQQWLSSNLKTRSKTAFTIRSLLHEEGFTEVETPCLFKSTPEGAREFLVPTRQKGFFFALPQSPQQFKQVLMAGGVEKYYQFARCFRDESVGSDRQQEFTQVDMELSFVKQRDIMSLIERMLCRVWKDILGTEIKAPFKVLTYNQAMSTYGSDKPDTRHAFTIQNVSRFFTPKTPDHPSKPFFEAMVIRQSASTWSNKQISTVLNSVLQESFPYYGGTVEARNLIARKVTAETISTGFGAKFAESDFNIDIDGLSKELNVQIGDVVFWNRRDPGYFGGHTIMGRTRLTAAKALADAKLVEMDPKRWDFLWVVDFPLFTPVAARVGAGQTQDANIDNSRTAILESTHHPFTAPMEQDAHLLYTHPEQCRAQHYDIVLNGQEIGGGSIRAHDPRMQRYILSEILKLSDPKIESDFGHLLDALRFGCPAHGGIALGFDRLVAIVCGASSIREVIAFPKLKGGDLFAGSPTRVNEAALKEYHISVKDLQKQPTMPATSISPQDPVANPSNVQAQMASTVDVFLSGGCLILCLGMIGFLLHTSNGAGFKVLYGTKNLYLVLLLAATSGYFAANSVEADSVADRAKSATRAAFFGLTAIFYINYSWIRSIGVLRQETSPTFVLVFKVILIATTVVCVLGPTLVGLPVWEYETGTRYSR
ncbi:hypothetical protein HDU78_010322, partial [Chytriomyces hyalinus]